VLAESRLELRGLVEEADYSAHVVTSYTRSMRQLFEL
jgi:hypothetical protein